MYTHTYIYRSKLGTGSIKTTHQKQDENRGFGPGQAAGPPANQAATCRSSQQKCGANKKEQTKQIHQVSANEVPAPDSQLPALLCHHVSSSCQALARLAAIKEALFAVAPMSAYGKIPPFSTLKRASFHILPRYFQQYIYIYLFIYLFMFIYILMYMYKM